MIIGVPKEVKDHESRVDITPAGVRALTEAGHKVLVETHAGELSAFPDDEYQSAGAEIVGSAHNVWANADMIVKVKEPVEKEYGFFREGLVLFTYLHLAPVPALTQKLLDRAVTGIAYETIRDRAGTLPLLTPMSAAAAASMPPSMARMRCRARSTSPAMRLASPQTYRYAPFAIQRHSSAAASSIRCCT